VKIKMELIHGPYSKSGFFIEVKHLQLIKDKNNSVSSVIINDKYPKYKNNE
jgi:hypothetical protein